MSKTLLIMAGGTGGHIFPGLAVADVARDAGWRVVWMGCPDSMESRLVPPRGYEMALMRFPPLRGKGLWRKLTLPFNLLRGFRQAWKVLDQVKPDVVLGMGGYVTFPGGMMAVLRGIPLVLHEQNSIPGLANRVLAGISDRILTGFPNVLVRRTKTNWCGNPVRPEIAAIRPPQERFAGRTGRLRILVLGGSLGAQALNDAMPKALALIPADSRPEVKHQAGEKHLAALQAAYAAAGVAAELVAFIDDMAAAYAWSDLVICRAGALTVAELAAVGIASLLVPYPHAVDDHQTSNARFLSSAGAAMLLPQEQLTPERLAALNTIPRSQLLQMAAQARARAKPDAAAEVARICMESAG